MAATCVLTDETICIAIGVSRVHSQYHIMHNGQTFEVHATQKTNEKGTGGNEPNTNTTQYLKTTPPYPMMQNM